MGFLGGPNGKETACQCRKRKRHGFDPLVKKIPGGGHGNSLQAMVFPVVVYGCESWIIEKTERQRIYAFELRCWRRLLWVPWTARISNQSILKEVNHEYSLEGLMLKLKLQYFGYLMQRANSLEKTLMLGKLKTRGEGDNRRRDGWIASLTWWTWVW